jgi:hypothetical protein
VSAVRAMKAGESSATIYASTQAGYDAAIADLTLAGGVIEVSGLDTLVLGTVPSNIIVLWFKVSGVLDITGTALTLKNNGPLRFKKLDGTTQDVLNLAGGNNDVVIAAPTSANLVLRSHGGVYEINMSETGLFDMRFLTGLGLSGGAAGTLGQLPVAAAAGNMPVWTSVAGTPGSAMTVMLHAQLWAGGVNTATPGTGVYVYNSMANADVSNYMTFTLPLAYTATTTWKVFWTPTGGAGTTVTHGIGMFKHTAAMDFSTATFTMGAEVTSNSPAADILQIDTVPTPALSLAAGDTVTLRLRRRGDTDSSTFSSRFIGLLLSYT